MKKYHAINFDIKNSDMKDFELKNTTRPILKLTKTTHDIFF